jgi:transcriptional regulator with XRE-family HTH domain
LKLPYFGIIVNWGVIFMKTLKRKVWRCTEKLALERGWDNSELAQAMGVKNSYLSRLRSGEAQLGDMITERICKSFGVRDEIELLGKCNQRVEPQTTNNGDEMEKLLEALNERITDLQSQIDELRSDKTDLKGLLKNAQVDRDKWRDRYDDLVGKIKAGSIDFSAERDRLVVNGVTKKGE